MDGSTLTTTEVEYGQTPVYTGETPTRPDAISAEYPDQMSSVWGVTVDINGNIQK